MTKLRAAERGPADVDGRGLRLYRWIVQPDLDALLGRWASLVRKAAKYSIVSGISVLITLTLLIAFKGGLGWPGATANLAAVSLAAGPSYVLNRYWTWGKRGPNHVWREMVPFWSMALLGLAFSTVLVALADRRWGTVLAVSLANLSAFGLLWIGRFVILDRVLFSSPSKVRSEGMTATPRAPRS